MDKRTDSILIHVISRGDCFDRETEAKKLALSLNYKITKTIDFRRRSESRRLLTKGFIKSLSESIKANLAKVVIIDYELIGAEITSLEKELSVKVYDRVGLILAVFSARAKSNAGKLQVSLANLIYQRSKLTKKWQHLERQRGGFGFIAGPGESQLEIDRRLLDKAIAKIKTKLKKLDKRRDLATINRNKKDFISIALVGYTNAGKSSLTNKLTKKDILVSSKPFSTLDPLHRRLFLDKHKVIITDSVGFINELPDLLIQAFASSLKEILNADIIINVRNIASKNFEQENEAVQAVISKLFINQNLNIPPTIDFINKCDTKPNLDHLLSLNKPALEDDNPYARTVVYGSALTNIAIDDLKLHIENKIKQLPTINNKLIVETEKHFFKSNV